MLYPMMRPENTLNQGENVELLPGTSITTEAALLDAFAEFLRIDVGNGDARPDTVRTYKTHVRGWYEWCRMSAVNPGEAGAEQIKAYRQSLVEEGMSHSTIALKLTILRRFYQAAKDQGLIPYNPVDGIRAPRDRKATREGMKYLSAGEAELLFRAVPVNGSVKNLRDRALMALMTLEGLRTVEIHRANEEDVEDVAGGGVRILVRGKGKDGYIYPREDTLKALKRYLEAREQTAPDAQGVPLFAAVGNRAGGGRISRDGIRDVVNFYLRKAGVKRPRFSCHALRHTCGALLYQATRDVKVVQETLRHSDVSMAAQYSHIVNRSEKRYTNEIPVNLYQGE